MLHRFRANLRFAVASGMATWCRDQMAVRHGMAVHINEGLANEEQKRNEVLAVEGSTDQVFVCDLPLMDEAHAADAFTTIHAIFPWVLAGHGSYIEHHLCRHDETPPQPCVIVSREVVA